MRYLLDTSVVSEPMRPAPDPAVLSWLRAAAPLDLCISVLTVGELAKGTALLPDGRRRMAIERWLSDDLPRRFAGRVLPVDEEVAHRWGVLSTEGRRAGRELPVIDGLLLATAASRGLILVTRNVRDCWDRGVPIFDPWEQR